MASWVKQRKALLEKVSSALMLEDDLILDEIETAESKAEAINRIEALLADAETALEILTG